MQSVPCKIHFHCAVLCFKQFRTFSSPASKCSSVQNVTEEKTGISLELVLTRDEGAGCAKTQTDVFVLVFLLLVLALSLSVPMSTAGCRFVYCSLSRQFRSTSGQKEAHVQ